MCRTNPSQGSLLLLPSFPPSLPTLSLPSVATNKAHSFTCQASQAEGGKDQAEDQGSPGCRGSVLRAAEGGVCLHHPRRGVLGVLCHVSRVAASCRGLKAVLSEVNFCSCVWGKRGGGAKETWLSRLTLTSLEGKPSSVGWGEEGRGDLSSSSLNSHLSPLRKKRTGSEIRALLVP